MATALTNGQATAVTLALRAGEQYSIAVPAGAENLVITLSELTADLDLYVKFGVEASTSVYDAQSSSGGSATETVTFPIPFAGTYYIYVFGFEAGSGLVTASFLVTASVPVLAGAASVHAPSVPFAFVPTIRATGRIAMNPEQVSAVIPTIAGAGAAQRPATAWALLADDLPAAQTIYTLTLTGAATGLPDVDIPMASFQTRLNEGGVHYLSAVVPDSRQWAPFISARNLGQWVVRKGYRMRDGAESLAEIVRVNFTSLAWSRGSSGDAATIYGHATVPVVASKSVTATGIQYESLDTNGKRRIRCDVSKDLAPGDWCIWSGGSMQVGEIVHYVGDDMAFMEVSES